MSARKVIKDVLLEPVGNMVGPGIHSVQVRKCKTHFDCWACLRHCEVNHVFVINVNFVLMIVNRRHSTMVCLVTADNVFRCLFGNILLLHKKLKQNVSANILGEK